MIRWSFVLIFASLVFLYSSESANASLLQVNKSGDVIMKVLSSEDEVSLIKDKRELTVREVANSDTADKTIFLKKKDEKFVLNVGEGNDLDVTDWKEDLIEIEERGDTKKINISIRDGNFVIEQSDISASTGYPITINPKENELSVVTGSGSIFLSVLPLEALETSLRSRLLSKITNKNLTIKEEELGVLTYSVEGEKVVNLLNLLKLNVPVTIYVSTTTGEILSVNQPKWLSILRSVIEI